MFEYNIIYDYYYINIVLLYLNNVSRRKKPLFKKLPITQINIKFKNLTENQSADTGYSSTRLTLFTLAQESSIIFESNLLPIIILSIVRKKTILSYDQLMLHLIGYLKNWL